MTPEDEIEQALDSISPEAKAWSRGPDVSAFVAGAVELEGEELAEFVRVVAQLAYDEPKATAHRYSCYESLHCGYRAA